MGPTRALAERLGRPSSTVYNAINRIRRAGSIRQAVESGRLPTTAAQEAEEKLLIAELGRDYVDYCGRTKRLIPFIY